MSKRTFVGVMVVALVLVLGAGSMLMASNMGFKLNRLLAKPAAGVSKTGQHYLALPYFRQTGINKAFDLFGDMGGSTYIQRISRLLEANDGLQSHTGVSAVNNFGLEAGVAYVVQIKATAPGNLNYIVVGSHDPSFPVPLEKPTAGVSKTGQNYFAMPYHFTGTKAFDMFTDMGGSTYVQRISRLLTANDGLQSHTGVSAVNNFPLAPGEGYQVQIKATAPGNLNYIPSHY